MGRKTAVILLVSGLLLLAIGGGGAIYLLHTTQKPKVVLIHPPASLKAPNIGPIARIAPTLASPPSISPQDQALLASQLQSADADTQRQAIAHIRIMAATDPRSLAIGFPLWVNSLLDAKQFGDIEKLAKIAIEQRPYETATVEKAQRGLVLALMAEGKYEQAVKEAKRYYNVVSLQGTNEAVFLLSDAMTKDGDPDGAARFRGQQVAGSRVAGPPAISNRLIGNADPASPSEASEPNILSGISIDSAPLENAISMLVSRPGRNGEFSPSNWLGRGNLQLLSGRAAEARKCFESACQVSTKAKDIRQAVEGVARSIRALDGNVGEANAFIILLQTNPAVAGAAMTKAGLPAASDLQAAAMSTNPAQIALAPPLEQEREEAEKVNIGARNPIQITSGFEGSSPVDVLQLSPTHFQVTVTTAEGSRNWFMFRLQGAAGQTVRIDVVDPSDAYKWWSLNPVYSYTQSLSDLGAFTSDSSRRIDGQIAAWNGPLLPDTQSQSWHYIANAWQERLDRLSFVQHFDADAAYIAMRVPYTPGYNDAYLESIKNKPFVRLREIGNSPGGRRLSAVEITEGGETAAKPCIFIYAREHANEQDTSWAVQGAIDFLLSSSAIASEIRHKYNLLAIPMLDPDGAAAGLYHRMTDSFSLNRPSPESIKVAGWLRTRQYQFDVTVNLHNVQSDEAPHLFCPLMSLRYHPSLSADLYSRIVHIAIVNGLVANVTPAEYGLAEGRLSEWMAASFGALPMPLEINSQEQHRHLGLRELKLIGQNILLSCVQFLDTDQGQRFNGDNGNFRTIRARRIVQYGQPTDDSEPFLAEIRVRLGVSSVEDVHDVELIHELGN